MQDVRIEAEWGSLETKANSRANLAGGYLGPDALGPYPPSPFSAPERQVAMLRNITRIGRKGFGDGHAGTRDASRDREQSPQVERPFLGGKAHVAR